MDNENQAKAQAGYAKPEDIVWTEYAPDLNTWQPKTAAEFAQRGWMYYIQGSYDLAEIDLRRALSEDENNPEFLYPLGMTLKAKSDQPGAEAAFRKTILNLERIAKPTRAEMLRHLCNSQLRHMQAGWFDPEVK